MDLSWFKPILANKSTNSSILIVGCGGGYDIFTGLPLYYALKTADASNNRSSIILGNLSFSDIAQLELFPKIANACYYVDAQSIIITDTAVEGFPEYKLSKLLGQPIYCFVAHHLGELLQSYKSLIEQQHVVSIIICDGGCDSVLSGVERELGTPVEDMMTLWTIKQLSSCQELLDINNVYLVLLGANVDTFADIHLDDWLNNLSQIDHIEIQLTTGLPEVMSYVDILYKMIRLPSIVNCAILSALEGHIGNYHHPLLGDRCRLGEFKIDQDTCKYYIFPQFQQVIDHIRYLDGFKLEWTDDDIDEYIENFNKGHNPHWKNRFI